MNKIISIIALLLILPIFKVEAYDFVIDEITYNFTKEHNSTRNKAKTKKRRKPRNKKQNG